MNIGIMESATMCRIFAVLVAVFAAVVLANGEAQPVLESAESTSTQSGYGRLHFSAVRGVDYDYVHFYPELETLIRAHVRPDGPCPDDRVITFHHMRNLASLSIRDQTIPNFVLFAGGRLNSLRMYNCQIEDFGGIRHMAWIKELHLRGCGIRDISFLEKVEAPDGARFPPLPGGQTRKVPWSVEYLSLANNNIEDIAPLSDCQDLVWLDLRDNAIKSVRGLKALRRLKYLDLRDNPLGAETEGDILAIKANNTNAVILLGQEARVAKNDLHEQLSARAKIAEFARCVRWRYEDGVVGAMLAGVTGGEELPGEISKALKCLARSQDKEYLADLAAVFIKYAIEVEENWPPGPVWDPGRPLLKTFLEGVDLKGRTEGMPALVLARWILDNRDRLAPSVFLDVQIEKYRELAH
jgi:hypothetical protein